MNIFFSNTLDVLASIKAHLAAMPLPGGGPQDKLFELVDYSVNKNLRETLTRLVSYKDRIALIVPTGDDFELKSSTGAHHACVARSLTVDLLIADRDYVDGRAAAFGDPGHLGVLAMKDQVISSLASAGLYPVLVPVEANQVELAQGDKDTPGRQCWVVGYRCLAGEGNIQSQRSRF